MFRVDFMEYRFLKGGGRRHKDFKTVKGAIRFIERVGKDYCVIKVYDEDTGFFDPIDYDTFRSRFCNGNALSK